MSDLELQRWRKELDPVELDLCGCKTSAKATSVAIIAVIALLLWRGATPVNVSVAVVSAVAIAVIAKLLGQRNAEQQQRRLISILSDRVQELEA